MASANTSGPTLAERPEAARASALADDLALATDDLYEDRDSALKTVLAAWRAKDGDGCDDRCWQAIGLIAGLTLVDRFTTSDGREAAMAHYTEHPESARAVRAAGVKLLAALGRAVVSAGTSGGDVDVAWGVAFVHVAAMRAAHVEIGAAIEALEADAARLVTEP